jgi:hypothetical protein
MLFLALWQVGYAESRLVVLAYPMPLYPGHQPGCLEYERDVGRPEREKLGINYSPETWSSSDSLSQPILRSPDRKDDVFQPTTDAEGHVWRRSEYRSEQNCPSYALWRDSTEVYHIHNCREADDPEFYIRESHWWIETHRFELPPQDSNFAYRAIPKKVPPQDSNFTYREISKKVTQRGYQIIADGEILSDKYGYSETWDLRYVGGKSFFSFRRDSTLGWNYDGRETITDFDQFFHDECCEPAISNPRFFADSFNFYAKRGNTWYLIVGEIKQDW